ncbi:hypothetical protein C7U57_08280 [Pseudomonas sp. R9.37]|nr:hypothetical protein C7U57_08280 [Pseudomonas sp. R9.37]
MCGSWLACDASASVLMSDRGDAIAGKPAPTLLSGFSPISGRWPLRSSLPPWPPASAAAAGG